eukprot:877801-Rhodomonas_salina.1
MLVQYRTSRRLPAEDSISVPDMRALWEYWARHSEGVGRYIMSVLVLVPGMILYGVGGIHDVSTSF